MSLFKFFDWITSFKYMLWEFYYITYEKEMDKDLNYGDRIILRCQLDSKCYYLMARSSNEELYYVESEYKYV